MRRLLILVLSIVMFTACHSVSDSAELYVLGESDTSVKPTTSGSSVAVIDDNDEFRQVLKEHANYGKLFESIMDNFDDALAIFDDYISDESVYMTSSFSDIREQLAFDFIGTGNSDMDIY